MKFWRSGHFSRIIVNSKKILGSSFTPSLHEFFFLFMLMIQAICVFFKYTNAEHLFGICLLSVLWQPVPTRRIDCLNLFIKDT